MTDLWMQIEGTKLIFIMNFSVIDFFIFASRMSQIAQILVSTFKIFHGRWGGEGGGGHHDPGPSRNFLSFFLSLVIPGSDYYSCVMIIIVTVIITIIIAVIIINTSF